MKTTLALFDFDGTITTCDTFFGFNKMLCGNPKYYTGLILYSPFIVLFLLKIISADVLKQHLLYFYLKGYNKTHLTQVAEQYYVYLVQNKYINPVVIAQLNTYVNDANTDVAIVSASADVWINVACKHFGAQCIATRLAFTDDGYFTGKFIGKNCNDQEKVERITEEYNLQDYTKIVAYGNSKHDIPMLNLAHQKNWV